METNETNETLEIIEYISQLPEEEAIERFGKPEDEKEGETKDDEQE